MMDQLNRGRDYIFQSFGEQPPGYLSAFTDELGRFILTIPERTGSLEFFVSHEKAG